MLVALSRDVSPPLLGGSISLRAFARAAVHRVKGPNQCAVGGKTAFLENRVIEGHLGRYDKKEHL
jgi:hypothetical protein